jgi:hypothetical protein
MSKFTHINEQGNAKMVDVSNKNILNYNLEMISMSVEKRNPIPVKEAINRVVQQDIYYNTIYRFFNWYWVSFFN